MKMWSWILLGVLSVVGVKRAGAQSLETNRSVLPFPPDFRNQAGTESYSLLRESQSYQQIFHSSSFAVTGASPIKITAIAFRVEEK
jgi:hypothetical protein